MCRVTIERSNKHKARKAKSTPTKRGNYGGVYTMSDAKQGLLAWYQRDQNAMSQAVWLKTQTTIPASTFKTWIKNSGLSSLLANNTPLSQVELLVNKFVENMGQTKKLRTNQAKKANGYMSEHEEQCIINTICLLGKMGHGLDSGDVLTVINEYLLFSEDPRQRVECTQEVLPGLRKRHPEVMKLVSAGSLDPARAKKANRQTRDNVFYKLDCYIRSLFNMGLVPWKDYSEIPKDCLYNMDEVGADTTSRRNRIYVFKELLRFFQVTPEGDGKMNMHVTIAHTSRADGECYGWLLGVGAHDGALWG